MGTDRGKAQRRKGRAAAPAPANEPPAGTTHKVAVGKCPPVGWRLTFGGSSGNGTVMLTDDQLAGLVDTNMEHVKAKRIDWFRVTRLDP